MVFGTRDKVTRMFVSALALGTAGSLAGYGYARFFTAPTAESVIRYEDRVKKFTEELREKGLAVKDVAREAAQEAYRVRRPFDSVYPELFGLLNLKPAERIRVIGSNGKSVQLKDYMASNPAIHGRIPGLNKKILELDKLSKKANPVLGGYNVRKTRYRAIGTFAGAAGGAALGYLSGRRRKDFAHRRK